ncbi:MAG: hypothetical protein LBK97_06905 [Prevotellaceae bacterium]|jgi:hypothetical protein|nr:hypothetical protein [Prevotellaceae bacterium]
MKKKIGFVLTGLICTVNAYSQNLHWNSDYLTISNIHSNGYTLKNSSDNTVKIKLYHYRTPSSEYIIYSQSSVNIKYPNIREFSRGVFDGFSVRVVYDLECYSRDLDRINAIAKQRIANAQSDSFFRSLLQIAGTAIQTFGGGGWKIVGRIAVGIAGALEIYDDVQKYGLSEALIMRIKNGVINSAIDAAVKNKYANTIVKSLYVLYDYKQSRNVDLKDLEELSISLAVCVSNEALFTYRINYDRDIKPVVDYDGDEITNLNDLCPNSFGIAKYGGCSRAEYRALRRKELRKVIKPVWLDIGYHYSMMGNAVSGNNFETKLSHHDLYAGLTFPILRHKYSNKVYGAFGLDVSYKYGAAVNSSFPDMFEMTAQDSETDRIMIKEQSAAAGISYNLVFRSSGGRNTILQSRLGAIAWSNIVKDIYMDVYNKEPKYYADLNVRFFRVLFAGVRYQHNPNYTFVFHDNMLSYPKESMCYYAGLTFRF